MTLTATSETVPDPDTEHALGRQLRSQRHALRLSLRDLAARSGLSTASISQIERNVSAPSLRSLRALCAALEMSMGELFTRIDAPSDDDADLVLRTGTRRFIDLGAKGMSKELLTPRTLEGLQMMTIWIEPGCGSGDRPLTEDLGARAGLVVKGQLGLEVDGRTALARQGDSFGFHAREGIRFWCASETRCEVLWVTAPRLYD